MLLVDEALLIDAGPDLLGAAHSLGLDLNSLDALLSTHDHPDHFHAFNLALRDDWGAGLVPRALEWLAPPGLVQRAVKDFGLTPDEGGWSSGRLRLRVREARPGQLVYLNTYQVTVLQAAHGRPEDGFVLFAVSGGARSLLYGTDTGPLPETAWVALKELARPLDLAILDGTMGTGHPETQHMNAAQVLGTACRLREEGVLAPGGRVLVTHFSHYFNPPHAELCALYAPHGIEVAHDGMVIEV